MPPEYKVYVNGKFVPESEAKVSVFDHGFLYGDGVFEGIRAYNGRVFRLEEHVRRLFESAKAIDLKVPMDEAAFGELILRACRENDLRDAYIRPIICRGPGDLGLDPRRCKSGPTIIVIARKFGKLYGDAYERGLSLGTVSNRRTPAQCLSPNIKSLNYLNNIVARIEANQKGVDEGLFLDMQGFVSEATADNIFIVARGGIQTPPTYNSLKGITRQAVIDIAREEGYAMREPPMTLFDVYNADEVFITGTAAEIAPIVKVDERTVGTGKPGPVTKHLMEAFTNHVNSNGAPIYPAEGAKAPAKARAKAESAE